jgi:hypothetical protein
MADVRRVAKQLPLAPANQRSFAAPLRDCLADFIHQLLRLEWLEEEAVQPLLR